MASHTDWGSNESFIMLSKNPFRSDDVMSLRLKLDLVLKEKEKEREREKL